MTAAAAAYAEEFCEEAAKHLVPIILSHRRLSV